MGEPVDFPILDGPRVIPRAEHRAHGEPDLLPGVLGKLSPGPLPDQGLVPPHDLLKICRRQLCIQLDPSLVLPLL